MVLDPGRWVRSLRVLPERYPSMGHPGSPPAGRGMRGTRHKETPVSPWYANSHRTHRQRRLRRAEPLPAEPAPAPHWRSSRGRAGSGTAGRPLSAPPQGYNGPPAAGKRALSRAPRLCGRARAGAVEAGPALSCGAAPAAPRLALGPGTGAGSDFETGLERVARKPGAAPSSFSGGGAPTSAPGRGGCAAAARC